MRVKFIKSYALESASWRTGEVCSLPIEKALNLIRAGIVMELPDMVSPARMVAPAPETRARRGGRG